MNAWGNLVIYIHSKARLREQGWVLLSVLAAVCSALVTWLFTYWQAAFVDSIASLNIQAFWSVLVWIPVFMTAEALSAATETLAKTRWELARRALDAQIDSQLLADAAMLAASDGHSADDLVQRTVEDIRDRASWRADFVCGFAASATSFCLFAVTLALVLPSISLYSWVIPVPMLLFALAIYGLSTWVLEFAGRPIKQAEHDVAKTEALSRALVARVREHARSIAALRGGPWEGMRFMRSIDAVSKPHRRSARLQARLHALGAFLSPSDILALIVLSPAYFAGEITFGQFFQAGMAHRGMGAALDWFAKNYATLAKVKSADQRVRQWRERVALIRKSSQIDRKVVGSCIEISDLTLHLPQRDTQSKTGPAIWSRTYQNLVINQGERVIIRAPSGYGKTTLFMALSGAWPWGSGRIAMPAHVAFVPQRHYFPVATLVEALAYPEEPTHETRRKILQELSHLRLDDFASRIDMKEDWNATISGGEAARLGLIRALISDASWLLLDEPSTGLDSVSLTLFWDRLNQETKRTVVLITHTEHRFAPPFRELVLA